MEPQGELLLSKTPNQSGLGEEVIFAQRSFSAAIVLAITASGLDDKEVYLPLKIDGSHWTKIKKGEAHFPLDKLTDFMDLVGNEIPLQWLANRRGKGLVVLESESQRLLKAANARADEAEKKLAYLSEFVKGKA